MNKMAEAFNTNVDDLELELMKLVADQPVRIDSHNKVTSEVHILTFEI